MSVLVICFKNPENWVALYCVLFLIVGTENLIGIHKIQLMQEIGKVWGFQGGGVGGLCPKGLGKAEYKTHSNENLKHLPTSKRILS